jgi:hypothetical protein
MALWTINPNQDHDIYTTLYLLKDALRSALSDAWFFERTALPKTEMKGANHAEIAARLGRFRDSCKGFQEREALMLMKLLRARLWAAELRKLVPEFQIDIDQFLHATAICETMQGEFTKDAQSIFNGGGSLARFLSRRKSPAGESEDESRPSGGGPYLVGGRKALYELRVASEVFLSQIEGEFFSSEPAAPRPALSLAFLDKLDESAASLMQEPLH